MQASPDLAEGDINNHSDEVRPALEEDPIESISEEVAERRDRLQMLPLVTATTFKPSHKQKCSYCKQRTGHNTRTCSVKIADQAKKRRDSQRTLNLVVDSEVKHMKRKLKAQRLNV